MTSPKEALITAKVCIEGENTTLFQKEALGKIQAAIPVAELHQQIVEMIFTQPHTDEFWAKMHEIRHKLEVLK